MNKVSLFYLSLKGYSPFPPPNSAASPVDTLTRYTTNSHRLNIATSKTFRTYYARDSENMSKSSSISVPPPPIPRLPLNHSPFPKKKSTATALCSTLHGRGTPKAARLFPVLGDCTVLFKNASTPPYSSLSELSGNMHV